MDIFLFGEDITLIRDDVTTLKLENQPSHIGHIMPKPKPKNQSFTRSSKIEKAVDAAIKDSRLYVPPAIKDNLVAGITMGEDPPMSSSYRKVYDRIKRALLGEKSLENTLEEILLNNALLANGVFEEKHKELSASEAATASSAFTQSYVKLKTARTSEFKEPPNTQVLIQLAQVLEQKPLASTKLIHVKSSDPSPKDESIPLALPIIEDNES